MADGFQVAAEAFARGFALPPKLTVSECADRHRYLPPTASSKGGRWRTNKTPYLRSIMDVLSPEDPTQEIYVMKGAQLGGTEVIVNWALYAMLYVGGQFLVYQPSLEMARGFNQDRIEPMIAMTPEIDAIVAKVRSRSSSYRALYKSFLGGALRLAGANSPKSFRQISADKIAADDLDGWPGDVGGEGDPISLLRMRAATFGKRYKLLGISTPTNKGESRIEKAYLASDQRRYLVPCPQCGNMDWIRFDNLKWTPGDPASVYLVCAKNGCVIEEGSKTRMLEGGEWVAQSPGPGKAAGFHISGLYSPLGWLSWETCVAKLLAVKDDPPQLKTWVNTILGETFDERPADVQPTALYARREEYPAAVPTGVGVLTLTVDTQDDCLVWQVTGFGDRGEMWIIDYGQIPGDPGMLDVWRDLDRIRERRYRHESGRMIPLEVTLVDAGGHHWDEVLAYCKPRQGYRVYAIHGGRDAIGPLVPKPTYKNKFRARLYTLCVNTGKDTLRSRLLVSAPTETSRCPGYVHLPRIDWCDEEYCAGMASEVRERVHVCGIGWTRKWTSIRERNEPWDLTVYALAGLDVLGDAVKLGLKERAAAFATPPKRPPSAEGGSTAIVPGPAPDGSPAPVMPAAPGRPPRAPARPFVPPRPMRPGFVSRGRGGFRSRWGR